MIKEELVLSVIVPVKNEHENIRDTIISLHKHVKHAFEIIFIYDSEEDSTLPVIKVSQREFKNIRFHKNSVCPGPSGAIRSGIKCSKAPYVLVTMGDLCDDHSQINQMLELTKKGADIVCPSRYCIGGQQLLNNSFKKLTPRLAGYLLHHIVGLPFDPTNSYKLYSKNILNSFKLRSKSSFSVTFEIIVKSHCVSFNIIEIPTVWKNRKFGKSNFKFLESIFTYLPWFFLALLKGKYFCLPKFFFRKFLLKKTNFLNH